MLQAPIKKHRYTRNPIIENPSTDFIYHLRYSNDAEILITFVGDKQRTFVDVSTFIVLTLEPLSIGWYSGKDMFLLPRNALPKQFNLETHPPVFVYTQQDGICAITTIEYNLNTVSGNVEALPTSIPVPINTHLKNYYQQKLKTPVTCGLYPIFEEKRPPYDFIASLYKAFHTVNNRQKLAFQYMQSENLCHMRAHFISEFLRTYYHLPTLKIYKYWQETDWELFHEDKSWDFHTAMAIIDDQSVLWVWDPWVGNESTLLTLEQWLYRHDEPLPTKYMLTHHSIIGDINEGLRPDGELFMRIMAKKGVNAFQAIFNDAIPNPPERPILSKAQILTIGLKQYGLFAASAQKALKASSVNTARHPERSEGSPKNGTVPASRGLGMHSH